MNARLRVALLAGFVLLVGVLVVTAAHAQEVRPGAPPPMRFEAYGHQQGFQGRSPRDFLLDRYGFVWVASQRGLARFDGMQFEYVDLNNEGAPVYSFPQQLTESIDGDIWVGMRRGGMVQFDRQTGRARHIPRPPYFPAPSGSNYGSSRLLYKLIALPDGRMGRSTYNAEVREVNPGGCLDLFDPATDTYTPVRTGLPPGRTPDLACEAFVDHRVGEGGPWLRERRGRLWLGAEGGIFHLEPGADSLVGTHTFYHEPYPAAGLSRLDRLVDASRPLAALTRVGKGADLERIFDLQEATRVLLLGVGDLHPQRSWDVGWLENARGDTLWAMDLARSAWGGGRASNRLVVDTLTLPQGRYRLRYRSDGDDWHFGSWQYTLEGNVVDRSDLAPSRPAWWGLQVFPLSASATAPPLTAGPSGTVPHFPMLPSAFLEARDGSIWIGTARGALVRYDPVADRYTPLPLGISDPFGLDGVFVRSLFEDEEGHVWVGVDAYGLYRVDPQTGRARHYTFLETLDSTVWRFAHTIHRILSDTDGTIWVGTGSGLVHLNPQTGGFNIYGRSLEANVPPATPVIDLKRGPDGALWFKSSRDSPNAMYRLAGVAEPVRVLTHVEGEARTLPPRFITGMVEADDGTVWVGSDRGLMQYDPVAGTLVAPDLGAFRAQFDREVGPLLAEANGDLWLYDRARSALHRYNLGAGTLTTFEAPDEPESRFTPQLRKAGGVYWYATVASGFFRFDPDKGIASDAGAFSRYPVVSSPRSGGRDRNRILPYVSDSLNHGELGVMHVGSDGGLWIGTDQGGLVRFDPTSESFAAYYDPVSFTSAESVSEGQDGTLWVGSFFGHFGFDPASGEVTVLDVPGDIGSLGSLRSNMLVADDAGILWSTTPRGLFRIDPERRAAQNIGVAYGNSWATPYLMLSSGEILNGGSEEGLVVIDPAALPADTTPPRVVLESLRAEPPSDARDGTSTNNADGESETEAISLYDRASLDLPYARNDVTIAYIGLEYDAPEEVTYEYQLEGYDARWQEAGLQRSARYTNLPAGSYTFRVRARNADGYWSDPDQAGASFALVVHPPWWRTGWAYVFYGLLFSAGVFAVDRVQRRRLLEVERRRAAGREAQLRADLAEERTQYLEALDQTKSRFFANVSHELRTPLTLLLGPVHDALAGRFGPLDAASPLARNLPLMQRAGERLLGLIEELLDLASLEADRLVLHAEETDLVALVHRTVVAFASRAEGDGLALSFGTGLDRLDAWVDAERVEQILSNLLANAFRFTPSGGRIRVELALEEGEDYSEDAGEGAALLTVRDTGQGVDANVLPHLFERFRQGDAPPLRGHSGTGIGLALVRELTELQGGTVVAESTPGFGSLFTVRLPLGTDHLPPEALAAPTHPRRAVQTQPAITERDAPGGEAVTGDVAEGSAVRSHDAPLVLIVEDHADLRAYLGQHLAPNYRLEEAADGQAGLEAARRLADAGDPPALVISDVMMPRLDGFGLCRALKADSALGHIPVVLLTARADEASRLEGLGEGADDYLAKPFSADELLARCENLIEVRRRLRALFSGQVVVSPTEVVVESEDAAWLEEVKAAVEAHLAEPAFTVEWLADALAMSTRSLQRRLKEASGLTPNAFLRTMRLERAAHLLRHEAGTVAEVARAVGYDDPSYFGRVFRQGFGVAPSGYAETMGEREERA